MNTGFLKRSQCCCKTKLTLPFKRTNSNKKKDKKINKKKNGWNQTRMHIAGQAPIKVMPPTYVAVIRQLSFSIWAIQILVAEGQQQSRIHRAVNSADIILQHLSFVRNMLRLAHLSLWYHAFSCFYCAGIWVIWFL